MTRFKTILVPTDFEPASDEALDLALAIAPGFQSRVTLLHAVTLPPFYAPYAEGITFPVEAMEQAAKRALDDVVAKASDIYPRIDGRLVLGQPWEGILSAIQELGVDLVVMGTHGRHGVPRVLLGSVAEKVVRASPVPVLTTGGRAR